MEGTLLGGAMKMSQGAGECGTRVETRGNPGHLQKEIMGKHMETNGFRQKLYAHGVASKKLSRILARIAKVPCARESSLEAIS